MSEAAKKNEIDLQEQQQQEEAAAGQAAPGRDGAEDEEIAEQAEPEGYVPPADEVCRCPAGV